MADAQLNQTFDPAGFYEFDLAQGSVRSRDGSRVILLSDHALAPLVAAAVASGDLKAVRRLGRALGQLVESSLSGEAREQGPDQVLSHCATVLALFGWGRLRAERWGRALVIHLDHSPTLDEGQLAVAALLGGMLSELGGDEVACVPIGDHGGVFLLLHPGVAEEVWNWSREGSDLAEIVGRLQRGAEA